MRRVLIGIGVVVVLLGIGVLIVPRLAGLIDYRAALIAQIEAVTGRQVSIDGDVTLSMSPSPSLSASGIRIANIPGASSPDMIVAPHAVFDVEPFSLASRKLRLTRVVLASPEIHLEVLPDGRRSWDFVPTKRRDPDRPRKDLIAAFEARKATIVYRDGDAALTLTGDFSYDASGTRPRLEASLDTGTIDANQFLPPRDSGPDTVRRGGERWSRHPLVMKMLNEFDGKISVRANQLRYRRYVFDQISVTAVLDNGQLQLESAGTGLFGGQVTVSGTIDARATPSLKLDVSLKNASVEQALTIWADTPFATGSFSLKGAFTALGDSEYAMISSLSGKARIDASDGTVTGFDAPRMSDQLLNLSRPRDFVDLADTALDGGETRYRQIGGTFAFTKGVADLQGFHGDLDAAEATADGVVDLLRWNVDMELSLRLTAADQSGTPPVGMLLVGRLNAPHRKPELQAMEKFLAKKFAVSVIGDVLDHHHDGRDEDPEDRREKAKRVLNGLFDKFHKRRNQDYDAPDNGY